MWYFRCWYKTVSGIAAYAPGYLDKELETIVGLQTDAL